MKKERGFIFTFMMIVLLFATLSPINSQAKKQTAANNDEIRLDAPITSTVYVHNNAELQALSSDGAGTPADPWIISDLVIDTTDVLGLRIDDTTDHFEIRNCTVTAGWGIYLDNVSDSSASIENNTVVDCSAYGIYLYNTNGTWIVDNILVNNARGIVTNDCYLTYIYSNYCSNEDVGIFIDHSPYASLSHNALEGDGIEIEFDNLDDMLTVNSLNNTVNGKPFILSKSESDTDYSADNGQLIVVNGSSVTIKDQALVNVDIGIAVYYSSHIHIR